MDWTRYPNFTEEEFKCSHTGICKMDGDFMCKIQAIRKDYGYPMKISSGYRHETHPIEAAKAKAGEHTLGKACDIPVYGEDAYKLIKLALKHGITRIGISQRGALNKRFLHFGTAINEEGFPSPRIWSY